jgi:hypothetical protein
VREESFGATEDEETEGEQCRRRRARAARLVARNAVAQIFGRSAAAALLGITSQRPHKMPRSKPIAKPMM